MYVTKKIFFTLIFIFFVSLVWSSSGSATKVWSSSEYSTKFSFEPEETYNINLEKKDTGKKISQNKVELPLMMPRVKEKSSFKEDRFSERNPFQSFVQNENEISYSRKSNQGVDSDHITLHCPNIQIRVVLQSLAELVGINLVISDQVKGRITLHLSDIAWKEALDIILKTQSLQKQTQGNILYIAPIEEIIKNSQKIQALEAASSQLVQLNQSKLFQVKHAKAVDLATLIHNKESSVLSKEGRLIVDPRTNSLWVQDDPTRFKIIQNIIEQFDIPTPQVLIEARIVNVTKEFAQDLGLRFGMTRSNLSGTLKGAEQSKISSSETPPLSDRLNLDLPAMPLAVAPASIGLALAKLGEGVLLDLELSALESEGRGEVISSPRLIAINQQAAIIEAGEEIPYQEAVSSGVTAVVFKKAVLSLKVIPRITPDSKILMDLKINQDIPSPKVFNGVPTILTKEIQTNALVNDGQTIVLGGIYKQDKNKEVNRVPFLGELPVVGRLFKNQSTSIRNEELLIFITPRIIKHMG